MTDNKQHNNGVTVHKNYQQINVHVYYVDLFTEQQLMYLEETIRMKKGPMEMQVQVVQVQVGTTNKVRTI